MLRPKFHFTPEKGWMNDPNGPVFFRGKYHIFYQHDPNSLVWDRMHWGHAVSDDLLSWEYLPIALFPDEMGDIYSGSCIVDQDNVSGLGSREEPPLLAFYTSHHMETKREQQCLAYSLDGITFKKYEGNPIVSGKEHTPARDPHVFINPVLGGFSMCFTTEKEIVFYHSDDLLSWEKTGEFHLPAYALSGMIECPCLIHASVENEDASKSVLLMSMDIPESEYSKIPSPATPHSRLMQYFVGTFDGYEFREENTAKSPLLVDYGPDFYAGTVFSNLKDPILIAWLGDFAGERKVPTEKEGFCGILSYPRKLSLSKKGDLYLLKQEYFPPFQGNKTGRIIDRCVLEEISDDGLTARTSFYS